MKKRSKNIIGCMGYYFSNGKTLPLLLIFAFLVTSSCPVKKLIQGISDIPTTQNSGGKSKEKNASNVYYASTPCTIDKSHEDVIVSKSNNENQYIPDDFLIIAGSSIPYYLSFIKDDVTALSATEAGFAAQQLPLFLAHRRLLI